MGEDPFQIKTRYGRPRTLGKVRSTVIYLYEKYKDVYPKAVELANREGISFSELVSRALKEYVEKHYPGNPQIPLQSLTGEIPPAKTLEARITARQLKKDLKLLKVIYAKKDNTLYRYEVESRVVKLVQKLAKLNTILKDDEYQDLIDEAAKLLGI